MTVYEPGGECLTKTQHDQREFRKKLQEKQNPAGAETAATPAGSTPAATADTQLAQAVKPVEASEKPAKPDPLIKGRPLDVSV